MIVAYLRHAGDRHVLESRSNGEHVTLCRSFDDFLRETRSSGARVAVYDVGACIDATPREIASSISAANGASAMLVRFDLTSRALRELPELAGLPIDLGESFRDYDDLGDRLRHEIPVGPRSATIPALRRLRELIPAPVAGIFVAALIAGERRVGVGRVAAAVGLASRTVAERLHAARLPRLKELIGRCVTLHVLWRLEILGWGRKEVARRAGFDDVKSCDEYVSYHAGRTPNQLIGAGGFERFIGEMTWYFDRAHDARARTPLTPVSMAT